MMTHTETRTITLVDLPLVARLSESGMALNSELGLTRDARVPNSTLLSSFLFSRELHTLVTRTEEQQVVGQFRYRGDEPNAHIVYIAPGLNETVPDDAWLHILDAMTREAGRYGAHNLVAEVEESSALFRTMRTSGFAVYARQVIWRHSPLERRTEDAFSIQLQEEMPGDHIGIASLMSNTIPKLVQQVAIPDPEMRGYVYRKNGRIEGYIAIAEGKEGVYALPHLHPDSIGEAAEVVAAALHQISRAHRVPVYVCVRAYQNWLDSALEELEFEPWIRQAVMVRHIAAGIRHPSFAPVEIRSKWEVVHSPVLPPANRIIIDDDQQEQIVG